MGKLAARRNPCLERGLKRRFASLYGIAEQKEASDPNFWSDASSLFRAGSSDTQSAAAPDSVNSFKIAEKPLFYRRQWPSAMVFFN